jgi:hypothetical protein
LKCIDIIRLGDILLEKRENLRKDLEELEEINENSW